MLKCMNDSKEVIMGDPDLFRISQIKNKEILNRILNGEYFSNTDNSDSAFYSENVEDVQLQQLDLIYKRKKLKENNHMKKEEIGIENYQIEWKTNKLKKEKITDNQINQWFNQDVFLKLKKHENETKVIKTEEKKEIKQKSCSKHIPKNREFVSNIMFKCSKEKWKQNKKEDIQTDFTFLNKQQKITGIFNSEVNLKKINNENSESIFEVNNFGKEMLNEKETRKLIDSSYNRYFFNNQSDIFDSFPKENIKNNFPTSIIYDKTKDSKSKNFFQEKFNKKRKLVKEWKELKKKTNINEKLELTEIKMFKENKRFNKIAKKEKRLTKIKNRIKKSKTKSNKNIFDSRIKKDFHKNQKKKRKIRSN